MKIFLCINPEKAREVACIDEITSWCTSNLHIVERVEDADAIITLGGDGTLIYAMGMYGTAYRYAGINVGHLGFLTTAERETYQSICTDLFIHGNYCEEKLFYLTYEYKDVTGAAINDVVIKGESISKSVHLDVVVNGQLLYRHVGDGIIASTPAGSTAYNLSVGGCIMHPSTKAYILNNIAPHLLSVRPLVLNERDEVRIVPISKGGCIVVDGKDPISFHEPITLRLSTDSNRLMRPKNWHFYELLRKKMSWGQRNGHNS